MIRKIFLVISLLSFSLCFNAQNSVNLPIVEKEGREFYVYEVEKGESLYGIAKKLGWDQDEIINFNPQAVQQINKGMRLYYPTGAVSNNNDIKEGTTIKSESNSVIHHTVKKGETVYNISRQYDIPLELIYQNNPKSIHGVKAGEVLLITKSQNTVPSSEVHMVEVKRPDYSNENVSIKREEKIIEEDTPILADTIQEENKIFEGVKIALLLDDPNSKKDIDFTRGFLVGLSEFKHAPFKIDLKVMDGGVSSSNLEEELDSYEPNLIISTADKNFPLFLLDYGNTNDIAIINVFDIKNNLYEDNKSIIQILPPSSYFNDQIVRKLYKDNHRRKLLLVGEEDSNDAIASDLIKIFDGNVSSITLEEFGALEPDIMEPLLIYSYASKKEEIGDFFNNVDHLADNYFGLDFKIAGRSNWIAYLDEYGNKYKEYSILIPSRVWVNEEADDWKRFYDEYEKMFDSTPVRSIPNFAASGFDIANYFIPLVGENEGEFNKIIMGDYKSGLQNDIEIVKEDGWNGNINGVIYLIKFIPEGNYEKITVK